MIYPTQRAVFAMALGIPLTLVMCFINAALWPVGAAWVALIGALICVDFLTACSHRNIELDVDAPSVLYTDDVAGLGLTVQVTRGNWPSQIQAKPEYGPLMTISPPQKALSYSSEIDRYEGQFSVSTVRRGNGRLTAIWLRWLGPLGLVWSQQRHVLDREIPIISNVKYVKQNALKFFARDASFGQKIELDRGQGSEFDSLRDFAVGMDKRAIDWKHSARHRKLQAKEFRTERNHNIVFAIDTGRLMCEPLDGIPRLDRALNAALLMAFVSLKIGDRIGIYSFDEKPGLYAKPVAGIGAFPSLQKQTAALDYSITETNFTLGLTQLSRTLDRRSLVIIFTDFVDTVSAEMMVENVARLVKKHLVLFVSIKDSGLQSYIDTPPQSPEDVSRAVIANALARERDLVLVKLRRLGVQIVDVDYDNMGTALINKVLDLKRREML